MFTTAFSFERFGGTTWVRFPVDKEGDTLTEHQVATLRTELERGFCVLADLYGYHVASFDIESRAWRAAEAREVIIARTGKVMVCANTGN